MLSIEDAAITDGFSDIVKSDPSIITAGDQ